eukprot:4373087-Prymnesium_polylepis.1
MRRITLWRPCLENCVRSSASVEKLSNLVSYATVQSGGKRQNSRLAASGLYSRTSPAGSSRPASAASTCSSRV